MKILMINKFLYPNGGSETYIFRLGACLEQMGHEVQFFGMEHEGRIVGNRVDAYTEDMDFHGGSRLKKLLYPIKTIYSTDARRKIRRVLDDFAPDVCHVNNFNYQLTPSILLEIAAWRKATGCSCRVVFTAHDYQLLCPNHMMNRPDTRENCEQCLHGQYVNCLKGRCIHSSAAKSAVGMVEAYFWRAMGAYRLFDRIICCSRFLKSRMDTNPVFADKTVAMHNFIDCPSDVHAQKKDYVLYFGRYSQEKGIDTLLAACRELPGIPFIFAGNGPLEALVSDVPNVKNVGFTTGDALQTLIQEARFSICPSNCYENCPFSVMESIASGTPVLGANIGGIPELIEAGVTGELFERGNVQSLVSQIKNMWNAREKTARMSENCRKAHFDTTQEYCEKLLKIYGE